MFPLEFKLLSHAEDKQTNANAHTQQDLNIVHLFEVLFENYLITGQIYKLPETFLLLQNSNPETI